MSDESRVWDWEFQSHIGYDSATNCIVDHLGRSDYEFQSHIGYDSATNLTTPDAVPEARSLFQSHIGYDSATNSG